MNSITAQTWINALPMGIGGYLALTLPDQHPGAQLSLAAALFGVGLWRELGGRLLSFACLLFVFCGVVAAAMGWAVMAMQPHVLFYVVFMLSVAGMAAMVRKVRV